MEDPPLNLGGFFILISLFTVLNFSGSFGINVKIIYTFQR